MKGSWVLLHKQAKSTVCGLGFTWTPKNLAFERPSLWFLYSSHVRGRLFGVAVILQGRVSILLLQVRLVPEGSVPCRRLSTTQCCASLGKAVERTISRPARDSNSLRPGKSQ